MRGRRLVGVGTPSWGRGGRGDRLGSEVSVLSFCSLLPTLEFSTGQRTDRRLVLVPEVGGGEVSVKRPKPRREKGWRQRCVGSKAPDLGLGSKTSPLAGLGYDFLISEDKCEKY